MRTIKELLEIMLERKSLFHLGLCVWSQRLYNRDLMSYSEYSLLKKYINENRPKWYSSFDALLHNWSVYYWEPGDIKPRIKWIQKHIKINS